MKNIFVPYELAVIAKEKGFNEKCINYYSKIDKQLSYSMDGVVMLKVDDFNSTNHVSAPLYQQIVDWFRKNHNIAIEPTTWVEVTTWMVRNRMTNETIWNNAIKDYYEGYNKAIEEALKLI